MSLAEVTVCLLTKSALEWFAKHLVKDHVTRTNTQENVWALKGGIPSPIA